MGLGLGKSIVFYITLPTLAISCAGSLATVSAINELLFDIALVTSEVLAT